MTRSDISFVVNKLTHFLHTLNKLSLESIKRILRYPKGTLKFGLFFKPCPHLYLKGLLDEDWASNLDARKSTSCYYIYLGNNLIRWSSRKQKTMVCSNLKSKYKSLTQASTEIILLQQMF